MTKPTKKLRGSNHNPYFPDKEVLPRGVRYFEIDPYPTKNTPAPRSDEYLYAEAFMLMIRLIRTNPSAGRILGLALADAASKYGKYDELMAAVDDFRVAIPGRREHFDDPREEDRFTEELAHLRGQK